MITVDTTNLSPLERAAVEAQIALTPRAEGAPAPAVDEFLKAFVARVLDAWMEGVVDAETPNLRPLAKRFLNLEEAGVAAVLAALAEQEAAQAG